MADSAEGRVGQFGDASAPLAFVYAYHRRTAIKPDLALFLFVRCVATPEL